MPKITKTLIDQTDAGLLERWIWDSEVRGFGVRVTPAPNGRKTYVVRYRTQAGTQRKQVLGRCSDFGPDKARELARKTFAAVATGADPAQAKKPDKAARSATVGRLFEAYVASMRAKGRSSADEVERALLLAKGSAADTLGRHRPAGSVTPAEVADYVAAFFKAGHHGAADKNRGYVASAYTWAMQSTHDYTVEHRQNWHVSRNPATDVPRDSSAVKVRDRNLSAAELRQIWLAAHPSGSGFSLEVAACIRVLIACGQRVQETLRMEGSEVDLKERLWLIPAEKTKGGKHPHAVPLPESVLGDLHNLISEHGNGPLFPARKGGGESIDHRSVMQALGRWQATTGAAEFQTRDLRRTWKSRAHDAGVDRFTRDLIQQHAKTDTGSKNYDRAEYLPQMREAMQKWDAWLKANLEPTAADLA